MYFKAVRGVGESNSTLTDEQQKRRDRPIGTARSHPKKEADEGKAIRSIELKLLLEAVSMLQGKDSSLCERPGTCDGGDC